LTRGVMRQPGHGRGNSGKCDSPAVQHPMDPVSWPPEPPHIPQPGVRPHPNMGGGNPAPTKVGDLPTPIPRVVRAATVPDRRAWEAPAVGACGGQGAGGNG
jgi:hypothetical protein